MVRLTRTDNTNPDFINLVTELDAYLKEIDGDDHAFYIPLNSLDTINYVIIAYEEERPVACGALKEYDPATMEIKRMYTVPDRRGQGIAARIVTELEKWTRELSYKKTILETGIKQPAAIALYKKQGYQPIPNFGEYVNDKNSVCFEKKLLS